MNIKNKKKNILYNLYSIFNCFLEKKISKLIREKEEDEE